MKTLLLSTLLTTNLFAATFVITPEHSHVEFVAKGKPALIKISGSGAKLSGTLDDALTGKIEFNLESLNTGIDLRDQHLKETYLKVKDFPNAVLTIDKTNGEEFEGKLSLHGKTNAIKGEFERDGEEIEANFQIQLKDFGIETPSFQGITVANSVNINVKTSLIRVKESQ